MDGYDHEVLAGSEILRKMLSDNPGLDLKQRFLKWEMSGDGSVTLNPMSETEMGKTSQLCE